jgi:hypothetical protein
MHKSLFFTGRIVRCDSVHQRPLCLKASTKNARTSPVVKTPDSAPSSETPGGYVGQAGRLRLTRGPPVARLVSYSFSSSSCRLRVCLCGSRLACEATLSIEWSYGGQAVLEGAARGVRSVSLERTTQTRGSIAGPARVEKIPWRNMALGNSGEPPV